MKLTVRHRGLAERPVVGILDEDARGRIFFEFDADWRERGLDLSPVHLPVTTTGSLTSADTAFSPLFGLFDDSLPDWWGQRIMRLYFEEMNLPWNGVGPLEKLACQGSFALGVLAYEPDLSPRSFRDAITTEVAELVDSARHILGGESENIVPALIRGGLSPGGAQPKSLMAFNDDFSQALAGGGEIPADFSRWLVKFQIDLEDEQCREEHAIALMAHAAGIRVPQTRLFETADGAAHFMSRRFDFDDDGEPQHFHSYAGLTHTPIRELIDYADVMDLTRDLTARESEIEEMFRRAVFNIAIANDDDHARNHAFLMDRSGEWFVSPAYDMTRSGYALGSGFRAGGVLGKYQHIGRSDLEKLAAAQGLRNVGHHFSAVIDAVRRWPEFAAQAGLSHREMARLQDEFPAMGW